MRKLILIFYGKFELVHLKKDVGLFPIYLKKYFDEVEILYYYKHESEVIPNEYRGIKLKKLNVYENKQISKIKMLNLLKKYIKKDENITHAIMFHPTISHFFISRLLKKWNNKVKVWIKCDMDLPTSKEYFGKSLKGFIRYKLIKFVDLLTTESKECEALLLSKRSFQGKLCYIPNGYDDELIGEVSLENKKNEIITVGRIGSYQKNTELLLDILEKLDLKDWSVKLIGPIEKEFNIQILDFFNNNPKLKNKVIFTGSITNQTEINKLYREASVFILISRYEGSALVLPEAAINGNYMILSEVGNAKSFFGDNKYAYIVPESKTRMQNYELMEKNIIAKLQGIINGTEDYKKDIMNQIEFCKSNYLMSSIIENNRLQEWIYLKTY